MKKKHLCLLLAELGIRGAVQPAGSAGSAAGFLVGHAHRDQGREDGIPDADNLGG